MFSKRFTSFYIIFFLLTLSLFAEYRVVLQSSHTAPPVDVQWHERTGTIHSVGNDGRLIVINPETKKVLHRFRLTNDRIHLMESNPVDDRIAIVTSQSGHYSISVWNWGDEKKLFSITIKSEPLFISWSVRGVYLIVGSLNDPSITVIRGRTGERLPYLTRLPSFYNSGYIGATETILMTYTSSGMLHYWDIRSSALKLSAETVPNLTDLSVLQTENKTSLFARRRENLYLISRQTGEVLDLLHLPGLQDVSVDPLDGTIAALINSVAGARVQHLTVQERKFSQEEIILSEIPLDSTLEPIGLTRGNGHSYVITEKNGLFVDSDNHFSLVVGDKTWQPQTMVFDDGVFYTGYKNEIMQFKSSFFSNNSRGDINALSTYRDQVIDTKLLIENLRMEILPDGRILFWDKNARNMEGEGIWMLNTKETPHTLSAIRTTGKINTLEIIDSSKILTVEQSGTINILDLKTHDILSEYSALGILDATYSSDGEFLLLGRSTNNRSVSSLEGLDIRTWESFPITDSRFMVYNLISGNEALYSVGVSKTSTNRWSTIIRSHDKKNPKRSRIIQKINKEDMYSLVEPNLSGRGVFTITDGEVYKINRAQKTHYQWNVPILAIKEHGRVVYGIDADGALVLWNGSFSIKAMLKIYFFKGGSWVALQPNTNKMWVSPKAIENIVIYKDGRELNPKRISRTTEVNLDSKSPLLP